MWLPASSDVAVLPEQVLLPPPPQQQPQLPQQL
jgi:hypothetical protein